MTEQVVVITFALSLGAVLIWVILCPDILDRVAYSITSSEEWQRYIRKYCLKHKRSLVDYGTEAAFYLCPECLKEKR